VTDIAAALPMLAAYTATAYMIGLLPFVHGDRFGWGDTSIYADRLHPKMVAEAKRKTVAAADQDAAQAAIAAAALAERNDARKIQDALKDDNMTRALKLYETRTAWADTSFDEAKLLVLGKGATRAKRHELAERILEACLARNGRQASQALVALAQLHAQQGNDARAEELYQRVVAEHPNTDAAKIAQLKLKT
jgi:tetratricopeptide (TPR) repeat protein